MSDLSADLKPDARLTLGMLPLVDAAPLVAALHEGFFDRQGLDVALSVVPSWANVRDRLQIGTLTGAQLLPLMPLAGSLGLDGRATPLVSAMTLSRNGNAITLSTDIAEQLKGIDAHALPSRERAQDNARALADLIQVRRHEGKPLLRMATVYPFSSHRYQLRYWLASAGIDPDSDLELRVIPPPAMVEQLAAGHIDGYCVGAPWNDIAQRRGCGRIVARGVDIWEGAQEKVFGVRRDWQQAHPATHQALLKALLGACRWLDEDNANRFRTAQWLTDGGYLDADPADVEASLDMQRSDIVFHTGAANFPWPSQSAWYVAQMRRWGHLNPEVTRVDEAIAQTTRPDLFRQAAAELGINAPRHDYRLEGAHETSWTLPGVDGDIAMASDRFIDGAIFDAGCA